MSPRPGQGLDDTPAGPSIRAQAKKDRSGPQSVQDRASAKKEVVKAVLANPLTVPWPNLPRHLQTAALHVLQQLIPADVAEYHVSRQRCHRKEKRKERKIGRAADVKKTSERAAEDAEDAEDAEGESGAAVAIEAKKRAGSPAEAQPAKRPRLKQGAEADVGDRDAMAAPRAHPSAPPPVERPVKPAILDHLVLGINETIKAVERQTDELRMRVMMMGDALAAQQMGVRGRGKTSGGFSRKAIPMMGLLPTAPLGADLSVNAAPEAVPSHLKLNSTTVSLESTGSSSLSFILLPLRSISPPSLVSPIPQYCATYNTLVYQHTHLAGVCRSRLPQATFDRLVGGPKTEVRVVPLGRVEGEMAEMVGLRRLACLGIKESHPQLSILSALLPMSVLHPPRMSLTLPFPTSALRVHNDSTQTKDAAKPADQPSVTGSDPLSATSTSIGLPSAALVAGIHYAPLHVKGITTTLPADGNAKKAKRLEEVRQKRREKKEQKRLERAGVKQKKGTGRGPAD